MVGWNAHNHTEIGTNLETGSIVWFYGGLPGSIHDLDVARQSAILTLLLLEDFIMADKGYIGDSRFITPFKQPQTGGEHRYNSLIYA